VSTSSWWPFKRRSDRSKKTKSPGSGDDSRLSETRRIVREAFDRAEQPLVRLPVKAPVPLYDSSLVYSHSEEDGIIHVNFHQSRHLSGPTFIKLDPITRKTKRVAKRFNKSHVYYRDDGKLLDDENWIG